MQKLQTLRVLRAEHERRTKDKRPSWPSPGAMAQALYPTVMKRTPALRLLDDELVQVADGVTTRLMWFMPPQEGKSVAVSRWFPLWMLLRNPNLRIAIASYELGVARRWGRAIRNEILAHPELGLRIRSDTAAAHEWELEGATGGVYCAGVGGALTGRPVDLMIIDDPVKGRAEAESDAYREAAKDWWQETVSARLGEATPIVLIMTRWHEDDLAGWLLSEDPGKWRVRNVPALADHDPNKGEVDLLDREPGEWLESARGRTVEGWEQRRKDFGERGFAALCQGKPSPTEGGLLKRTWWRFDPAPLGLLRSDGTMFVHECDQVIQSWDMTFKDTSTADYVVGQVWARRGAELHLLDQVRDRMDFPATCRAVEALSARWPQATLKLVEDKANGPAVIAQLRRVVPGLVAVNPRDSKAARVAAVSPFVEAGNVYLPPTSTPWVSAFIEEAAGFPNASHDDQVDALSQAVSRLMLSAGTSTFFDQLIRHMAGEPPASDPVLELPTVTAGSGAEGAPGSTGR